MKPADLKETREACPYDIPRWDEKTGGLAKCTMCIDRITEGMLPSCAKTCPTGGMNFGDRNTIIEMANKRLAEVKGTYKDAMLADPGDVRVIYLLVDDPKNYHKNAVAENTIGITRKMAIKRLFQPLKDLNQIIG